jgi:cytochrome oxidase assembly protein ShyY1
MGNARPGDLALAGLLTRPAARREKLAVMWPIVITVLIIVPLLVLAWWQMQRRR